MGGWARPAGRGGTSPGVPERPRPVTGSASGPVGLGPLVAGLAPAPQMKPCVGRGAVFISPKQHQESCCWHMAPQRACFTSLGGRQPGGPPRGSPHPLAFCEGGGQRSPHARGGGPLPGRAAGAGRAQGEVAFWLPLESAGLSVQPPRGAREASQGHISLGPSPLGTAVNMGSSVCRTERGGQLRRSSGGPHPEPSPVLPQSRCALIPTPDLRASGRQL